MKYKGTVLVGNKEGRTIGFPTVNLSPTLIPQDTKLGVYSSKITFEGTSYLGALYFGPRLVQKEAHNVLEIFILDFNLEIYGKEIEFSLNKFIRPPMNFSTFEELKKQLNKDIEDIRKTISG